VKLGRISILASDLGSHALYTPWMFAGALSTRHPVDLIGPTPERIWLPAEDEVEITGLLPARGSSRAALRAAARAAIRGSDLLYAFKAAPASFGVGLWLRRKFGVPLAVHLDDWEGGYFAGWSLSTRAWHLARGLRSPDNEFSVRRLEARVPTADMVTVSTRALQSRFGGRMIRQGVDTERFSPRRFQREDARHRLGLEPEVPMVLFLGTPAGHKGLSELVEAAERLTSSCGTRLWVVGDPPRDQVDAPWRRSPVARYVPSVPFAEAPWYIAACDVFVVPQRPTLYARHQLPAKLLLAMALGACIIGTDVGDVGEVLGVGGSPAGLIVPPGDVSALSEALEELLRNPDRRASLSAEGRRRAEELYSWGAMRKALDEEITKLGVLSV
jgi:glycosyltransferase involved in cell wall biosynthesis